MPFRKYVNYKNTNLILKMNINFWIQLIAMLVTFLAFAIFIYMKYYYKKDGLQMKGTETNDEFKSMEIARYEDEEAQSKMVNIPNIQKAFRNYATHDFENLEYFIGKLDGIDSPVDSSKMTILHLCCALKEIEPTKMKELLDFVWSKNPDIKSSMPITTEEPLFILQLLLIMRQRQNLKNINQLLMFSVMKFL